jgi:hypothetical protein
MDLLPFNNDLNPPPLVEDPDRFYRSGEKNNIGNSPGKPL